MKVRPIQLIIAGAQKAGTTSLLQYLSQHPDIDTHPHREMSYFLNSDEYDRGYAKAFARYFGHTSGREGVLLAKHVMIMYSPEAIKRLKYHNPNTVLITLIRNPVNRAYSAYWYARRRGWENSNSFEDAIMQEASRLREGWYKWRNCAYLYNGLYHEHITHMYQHFRKERVHVFLTEDLTSSFSAVCQQIISSVNIESAFLPDVRTIHNVSAAARSESLARASASFLQSDNMMKKLCRFLIPDTILYKLRYALLKLNEREFIPPPINPSTRENLIEYFKPFNAQLSDLLGRDLSHWSS